MRTQRIMSRLVELEANESALNRLYQLIGRNVTDSETVSSDIDSIIYDIDKLKKELKKLVENL